MNSALKNKPCNLVYNEGHDYFNDPSYKVKGFKKPDKEKKRKMLIKRIERIQKNMERNYLTTARQKFSKRKLSRKEIDLQQRNRKKVMDKANKKLDELRQLKQPELYNFNVFNGPDDTDDELYD